MNKAYLLLYEIIFNNLLIFKSILCQTGVTKALELALELIKLAEHKWPELLGIFERLGLPLASTLQVMSQCNHVYYNISKLLICYLINKIELDYSISQQRTRKQLHMENYYLAVEINRWLTDKNLNRFGSSFDPIMAVLNRKFIQEALQSSFKYRQSELAGISDEVLLNTSLSTITSRHDRLELQGDMVKDSIIAKAKIAEITK